jgi:hypothetical protein
MRRRRRKKKGVQKLSFQVITEATLFPPKIH